MTKPIDRRILVFGTRGEADAFLESRGYQEDPYHSVKPFGQSGFLCIVRYIPGRAQRTTRRQSYSRLLLCADMRWRRSDTVEGQKLQ